MTRIDECKLGIIGITELLPKNSRYIIDKAEVQIDGYDLFTNDLETKKGRGVILYANQQFKAQEVKFDTQFEESIWIKINQTPEQNILIGCIYRSPSSNLENLHELCQLIDLISNQKNNFSHIVIMGDFNLPKINWDNWTTSGDTFSETFMECIRRNYLFQSVTKPTRGRQNNKPSTIDLILTNDDFITSLEHNSPI